MVVFPPFVAPGSRVALVAPSSPFDDADFRSAVACLEERFEVTFTTEVGARDDYLAGSDARRLEELQAALDDDDVRAIIAIRGGFGAGRVVGRLDATRFEASPKWIVGFSDITVLHSWAHRRGVASVHGPNAGGIGRSSIEAEAIVGVLTGARREATWAVRSFDAFEPVEGVAAGGNLTVLMHEALAGRWPPMGGRVLFLEDVGERVYRIDRMLAGLADGGFFEGVKAVVFGHFTRCDGAVGGRTLERLARELGERLGVPIVLGAPFGHEDPNEPFVQGARVRVTPTDARLAFGA
jgi:muramoyltetrapeptide carboxypeptidase